MSLFQRAHDVIAAETGKALDAAEMPDELLDLSYVQMLDQITQVRRALNDFRARKEVLKAVGRELAARRRLSRCSP